MAVPLRRPFSQRITRAVAGAGHDLGQGDGGCRLTGGELRQPLVLLGGRPAALQGHRGQNRAQQRRGRDPRPDRFPDEGGVEQGEAEAAVSLADHQPGDPELGQRRPGFARDRTFAGGEGADAVERRDVGENPGDALLEHALFAGEGEIHQTLALSGAGLGSRGMPRPRSEMMFFWIWAVPPPMIRPRSNM